MHKNHDKREPYKEVPTTGEELQNKDAIYLGHPNRGPFAFSIEFEAQTMLKKIKNWLTT